MYSEKHNHRGFLSKASLLKLLLFISLICLLVWILPKAIKPKVISNSKSARTNSPFTSQVYTDNLEKMKDVALTYYTEENLPDEIGKSNTITLNDMIKENKITTLMDNNNKSCDVDNSYVEITKINEGYLLKINLKDSSKEDYLLVHLGKYSYCKTDICEIDYTR